MADDPITENPCPDPLEDFGRDVDKYETKTCGTYRVTHEAEALLREGLSWEEKKYLLAGTVREASENGQELLITAENIDAIIASANPPKTPIEAIDRVLLFLLTFSDDPSRYVSLEHEDFTITFSRNFKEFNYYIEKAHELGYTEISENIRNCRLSLIGWQRVFEIHSKKRESKKVFVAMWFDDTMTPVWNQGFKPALESMGFIPVRVDLIEHNDKIDDRIIAEIKQSGLLVADFTGNRGGVYFEAGFALGLGLPVIWCCRNDFIDTVHFDTRQYAHVVWSDPEDLRERLSLRIQATLL